MSDSDVPAGLTPALTAELTALNSAQRRAVLHLDSLVVRAGPGSGKTRTLVAKAAYLLETTIPPRRGLAAITYTRPAAREIEHRLRTLQTGSDDRAAVGTLHGWCLRCILRPYGPLVGIAPPGAGTILTDNDPQWLTLLQRSLDATGVGAVASHERAAVTRIRRRLAAGIVEDDRDPLVRAAIELEKSMIAAGTTDFDLMISQSLAILRDHTRVTELVAARFPWLIVDEYQDLGPVLHSIVNHLHNHGVAIAAFGDPDQTIYHFTGADPTYLKELASHPDITDTGLDINYRCGSAIIAASHATVDGDRDHRADPSREDPGVVELLHATGPLDDHAALTLAKIDELAAVDVPEHHIAVFYPSVGPLLDELRSALDASIYDYIHEGDQRLPSGDLADFIRDCAARAVAGPQPIGYPDTDHASTIATIRDLAGSYLDLLIERGMRTGDRLQRGRLLSVAVKATSVDTKLIDWLECIDGVLDLTTIGANSTGDRDCQALADLREAATAHNLTVGNLAGALRTGKITLTTYHSAKGREWDYVIMPGLVDGIMPRRRWSTPNRLFLPTPPDELEQARHSFYVGLTRARRAVVLIDGSYWLTRWGKPNWLGVSPFATMVRDRLAAARRDPNRPAGNPGSPR